MMLYNSETPRNGSPVTSTATSTSSQASDLRATKQDLSGLIVHTFLTRKLPDSDLNEDLESIEELMLRYIHDALAAILAKRILPELESTRRMFEKWIQLQPKSTEGKNQFIKEFQQEAQGLRAGETISLYIRKQNGTIMITKIDDEKLQIRTFRSSLSSKTVMSTVGSLVMDFPETNEVILNADMLASKMFASHLHELSTEQFEIATPKSEKGGNYYSEHREVSDSFLLSDGVVGLLIPAALGSENISQIKVTKKVRDEVNCKTSYCAVPFRRSGMWMSVKAALQLQIVTITGNTRLSKMIYKCVVLRTLASICEDHHNKNMDTSSQMLAKIGRRVKKLEDMQAELTSTFQENFEVKAACLEFVEYVVETVSKRLNAIWEKISEVDSHVIPPIKFKETEISNSLKHNIPSLDEWINPPNKVSESKPRPSSRKKKKDVLPKEPNRLVGLSKSLKQKRYFTLEEILSGSTSFIFTKKAPTKRIQFKLEIQIWLHDTENFIKKNLDESSPENVSQLILAYVQIASPAYNSGLNPVGFSQMLLCVLKSLYVLDKSAATEYPLLLEFKSGIDTVQFDKLLLSHKEDMQLLDTLLDYFQDRDIHASFPNIVSSRQVNFDTFAVRFAKNDKKMQSLRSTILADTDKKIAEKKAEVDRVRGECKELLDKIKLEGSCKCEYTLVNDYYPFRQQKIKTFTCHRCDLESKLKMKRCSVRVYESPLPPIETNQQYALMFELLLPSKLEELRDALAFFKFEILKHPLFGSDNVTPIYPTYTQKWLSYSNLTDYQPACKQGQIMNLFSTCLPVTKTHHTQIRNPDVLTNDCSSFLVNNGMNCVYDITGKACASKNVEESCTFQISKNCSPDSEVYQNLQYTVTSSSHNQNRVIAESFNCHKDMTIVEFISFGSVRAGHRIQLRNLYRSISNQTLALEKEATTCLILQTIWEVGQKDNGNRESHLDFTDNDLFSQDFLDLLEKVVDQNETNYSRPLVLFNVVIITMRIMELNHSCLESGAQLMRKCRNIVDDWVKRIEESIMTHAESYSHIAAVESLKKAKLEATLCSAFSYNTTSATVFNSVTSLRKDLIHWFSTKARFYDLVEVEQISTSDFIKSLVHSAFEVGLKIQAAITPGEVSASLHTFASKQWNKANECSLQGESWDCVENLKNLFLGNYIGANNQQHFVAFDIVTGVFTVDGQTQATLPSEIEYEERYRLFFNGNKLKVQKDKQTYRTVVPFHGKHYEFIPKSGPRNRNPVQIKELNVDATLDLLDRWVFKGHLAPSFITNYTHWLNASKTVVYFRPLPGDNSDYNLPTDFTLVRCPSDELWMLQDAKSGCFFLSIQSQEFKTICKALEKIEKQDFINVIVDPNNDELLTAKLPRYNLKFNLVGNYLQSVEYPDFKISSKQSVESTDFSSEQSMGTFVGLQQGILLDNIDSSENLDIFQVQKRMLLMPHGSIHVREPEESHQAVEINLENLQQPPFFCYEFDEVLKRLKADKSKSAWLYLAALHAATSSSLPDVFTGITGTEMAVWILQSAFVWSCSPYDCESLAILKTIKGFSPIREYYQTGYGFHSSTKASEKMESTRWPRGLPSLAAFDGFSFIVDKLILDSQRLAALFPTTKPLTRERYTETSTTKLQMRAYRRSLSFYNQNVAVKPEYLLKADLSQVGTGSIQCPQLRTELHCKNLIAMSEAMYYFDKTKYIQVGKHYSLVSYLITSENLDVTPFGNLHRLSLGNLLELDFRKNWLRFYSHSLSLKKNEGDNSYEEMHAWRILLATLSYHDASLFEKIMNLHFIASYADYFPEPPSPPINYSYGNPKESEFVGDKIKELLMRHSNGFSTWEDYRKKTCSLVHSDEYMQFYCNHSLTADQKCTSDHHEERQLYEKENLQFESQLKNDVGSIINALRADWPCQEVKDCRKQLFLTPGLRNEESLAIVNAKLNEWYKNHELTLFVQDVEQKLNTLIPYLCSKHGNVEKLKLSETIGHFSKITTPVKIVPDPLQQIDLEMHLDSFVTHDNLTSAMQIFKKGWVDGKRKFRRGIWEMNEVCSAQITRLLDCIVNKLQDNIFKKIMFQTGICPRTIPLSLLPVLKPYEPNRNLSQLEWVVGAMTVLWTHQKRHNRIITLNSKRHPPEAVLVETEREMGNPGHTNWSPAEHPEWLLLELELDMMIRQIQVEVAIQMMKMPDEKNGVVQLNMGEGKTSVIVPMLCAALANEATLCRVTVLNSIFKTNFKILSFAIGGLLNRRLYTFPCRRDMDIEANCLQTMTDAYAECLRMNGVVLTRPEHSLSFRLKVYDQIVKGNAEFGMELLKMENWLRKHVRDIMDESDELLGVKYQLVYTTGTQAPVDGGELRWKTCQKILKIVMDIASDLFKKFDPSVVEYNPTEQKESPEKFNHFRLLSSACKEELCSSLADRFLQELKLTSSQRSCVKLFLTDSGIDQTVHSTAIAIFADNPELLSKIFLVSGYIRRGILELALSKRWRVEYGVDLIGQRKMAVPFRAKHVAAERTEFGHPDLAIILTHLSYYYSGLSEKELLECFAILKAKPGPDMIYSSWLQVFPEEKVPNFLQTYQGVNTKDPQHLLSLLSLFRQHKLVIDFWLTEKVFPRESKQFRGKIVMTAWDLCYERKQQPICGFSGTNDSSILLPLQITQQDLPGLLNTNQKLEETLLQPNNKGHKGFPFGVTCRKILEEMKKDGLQVLIDSGAMMLECDNEAVAKLWLEADKEMEAVVYFSHDNDMMVKCQADNVRNIQDVPLELSPYRNALDKCGVFLDDQHSRGTDLKFPDGLKACVTVGTRMRRDKLMQACMRMRKLDKGHSVTFYLSHEAYDKVKKLKETLAVCESSDLSSSSLETQDVINWVCHNTKKFNEEGMLYWALAGKNYAQKLAAEDTFHYPKQNNPTFNKASVEVAKILGAQCLDDEILLLKDMYGVFTTSSLLVKLIPGWFDQTMNRLRSKNGERNLEDEIQEKFSSICNGIVQRCTSEAPEKLHITTTLLVEEHEKELELEKHVEVEEEREIQRPKLEEEAVASLHPNVLDFVLHGNEICLKPGIMRLCDVFQATSFWSMVQPSCWGTEVFATGDFISVIKTQILSKTDMHLRPIEYLASRKDQNGTIQLLILSPFEVNELMPNFRKGETSLKLHMFTTRRYEKQDVLINNGRLQLPICQQVCMIPEGSRAMAAMLIASGSLYFNSKSEQEAFARFLALVPQPWTEPQTLAFEQGMITNAGFLRQDSEFRRQNWEHFQVQLFSFKADPIGLVKKILSCRHPIVNEVAHVLRLLDETFYVPIDQ